MDRRTGLIVAVEHGIEPEGAGHLHPKDLESARRSKSLRPGAPCSRTGGCGILAAERSLGLRSSNAVRGVGVSGVGGLGGILWQPWAETRAPPATGRPGSSANRTGWWARARLLGNKGDRRAPCVRRAPPCGPLRKSWRRRRRRRPKPGDDKPARSDTKSARCPHKSMTRRQPAACINFAGRSRR